MSRRDTIIIAVLINTGMLAILFMMAIHTEDELAHEQYDLSHSIAQEQMVRRVDIKEEETPIALAKPATRDEVDVALKEYVSALKNPSSQTQTASADQHSPYRSSSAAEKKPTKAPSPNEKQYVEVTIKRGDCLGKIALANNTTVKEIKDANGLQDEKISTGQVIRVPINTRKKSQPVEEENVIASSKPLVESEEFYTIRKGDNPWKIAKQFHVRFEDLLILNNLDEEKAKNLKIGDSIRVK